MRYHYRGNSGEDCRRPMNVNIWVRLVRILLNRRYGDRKCESGQSSENILFLHPCCRVSIESRDGSRANHLGK